MASLSELVAFMDRELDISGVPDYPGAVNGLQLSNKGRVGRIYAAVDASLPVIQDAAEQGAGLLVVHHGMFWQGVQTLTGPFYRKIKIAMDADLAIYSAHLPLDIHPVWGNNALLAQALGVVDPEPFFDWKGISLGLRGSWKGSRFALAETLGKAVGGSVHVCPGGPEEISSVGLITGGAGSEVSAVARCGIDTFITGEGPHWSHPLALELGVNLLFGGHYATETFGVKAMAEAVAAHFGLSWCFKDHPSGL